MQAGPRTQSLVVQAVESAEDYLPQHLQRAARLLEVWGPEHLREVVSIPLLGWSSLGSWPEISEFRLASHPKAKYLELNDGI